MLAETGRADFPYLKRILGLTDGNLGRHIEVLAKRDLVSVTKGYEGKRPRTWIEITDLGAGALKAQVAGMRQIIDRVDNADEIYRLHGRIDTFLRGNLANACHPRGAPALR